MLEIKNKSIIHESIKEICKLSDTQIDANTNLISEIGLNSLSFVELFINLEEKFEIELNESDLVPGGYNSVQDLYNLFSKYLNEAT